MPFIETSTFFATVFVVLVSISLFSSLLSKPRLISDKVRNEIALKLIQEEELKLKVCPSYSWVIAHCFIRQNLSKRSWRNHHQMAVKLARKLNIPHLKAI